MTASHDLTDLGRESRYDRQERITWWDQTALAKSRVLVVGAGALGNEIVKSLALLGVGRIVVVDMDQIENSNLSRCALFQDGDVGRFKAEVVAERAALLNPGVALEAWTERIQDLGAGAVFDVDLVVAGLDNREARLWVGQTCRLLGRTWIDGAIEGIRGLARVFLPEGACYECTLGETDREILAHRRSCALLSQQDIDLGKTPTNVTTAALIAAIEVQEAVKILVGRSDLLALRNAAWMYVGETLDAYVVAYDEDEFCLSHDHVEDLLDLRSSPETAFTEVVESAGWPSGDSSVAVGFGDDLILAARCPSCGAVAWRPTLRQSLGAGAGECSTCGGPLVLESTTSLAGDDPLLRMTPTALGLRGSALIEVRDRTRRRHVLIGSAAPRAATEGSS